MTRTAYRSPDVADRSNRREEERGRDMGRVIPVRVDNAARDGVPDTDGAACHPSGRPRH
ncbi:hypothetical protein [Streptomyces prasinus]|uniref:hypothetical protein n=1 Tax=Streptomyces prasinus TaxID=67345 RepID=UPI00382271D6